MRPIHRRMFAATPVAIALLASAIVGAAGPRGDLPPDDFVQFKTLDYTVTPALFREMCDLLALSDEQRKAAERAYNEYWPRALSLDQSAQRVRDDAGHAELQELYDELVVAKLSASRPTPGPTEEHGRLEHEIGQLKHEVSMARWRFLRRSDALVVELFTRCQSQAGLTEEQCTSMERHLRRRVFLPSASQGTGDFRLTVNLHDLLSNVLEPGGELALVPLNKSERVLIADAMTRYEIALDLLLRRRWHDSRERPALGKPVYRSTDPEYHERRERAAGRTRAVWTVQKRLITDIFNIIFPIDSEAAEQWRTIVRSRMCRGLYREFPTETLIEWIRRAGLPAEHLDRLELLHIEFLHRHEQLRDAAFESGIRAACDADARYGGSGANRLNLRHGKNQFAIHERAVRYLLQVKSFLDSEQREALRRKLRGERGGSSLRLLGPLIDTRTRTALGIDEEYNEIRKGAFLD